MGGLQLELQMSWQSGLLSQRRKVGGPLGLKNLGNSCYLNSVLQCLTHTPPLANFCLLSQHSSLCDSVANGVRKRDCPFCILERRIARSLSSDVALDAPSKIQSCLKVFADHFRAGCQEDAHEFLRYVIDACHNSCLRLMKLRDKGGNTNEGSTVVKKIFGGALQSQVTCLSCNSDSNKVDEIMDISLDVMYSNSVKEAMHKFFQPEVLDGNNKYKCEKCKKLVAARKQMSFLHAPNVLVIQLKRFEGLIGKIDKSIAFQEVLLLSSFMAQSSKDPNPEYKLFGTIVHSGCSPESGHYYAYIKDALGRWYCCNDSYVSLANLKDVLSEKVYILFFSRSNQKQNALIANGVKSCNLNGGWALKSESAYVLQDKSSRELQHEKCLPKDSLETCKTTTHFPSHRIKINIVGNGGFVGVKSTSETISDGTRKLNRSVTEIASVEKCDSVELSLEHCNASTKGEKTSEINGRDNIDVKEFKNVDMLQNGIHSSAASTSSDCNGVVGVPVKNGYACDSHFVASSKRKTIETACIFSEMDQQSQVKIKELKHTLEQEALSVLRTCSWYDDVYNSMSSRKRLCVEDTAQQLDSTDLKKLLIAGAKSSFTSQVPESLKQRLVERLRSFIDDPR